MEILLGLALIGFSLASEIGFIAVSFCISGAFLVGVGLFNFFYKE
jgi:hypothetical protein